LIQFRGVQRARRLVINEAGSGSGGKTSAGEGPGGGGGTHISACLAKSGVGDTGQKNGNRACKPASSNLPDTHSEANVRRIVQIADSPSPNTDRHSHPKADDQTECQKSHSPANNTRTRARTHADMQSHHSAHQRHQRDTCMPATAGSDLPNTLHPSARAVWYVVAGVKQRLVGQMGGPQQ
jgi:hypothetical protein